MGLAHKSLNETRNPQPSTLNRNPQTHFPFRIARGAEWPRVDVFLSCFSLMLGVLSVIPRRACMILCAACRMFRPDAPCASP